MLERAEEMKGKWSTSCRQTTSGWWMMISSRILHLLLAQSRARGSDSSNLSILVPMAVNILLYIQSGVSSLPWASMFHWKTRTVSRFVSSSDRKSQ